MASIFFQKVVKRFRLWPDHDRGFTLIELLTVLVIIAILAAVSAPIYMNYVKGARAAEAQTTMSAINTAEKVYYQKFGKMVDIQELQSSKELQIDPATASKWNFEVIHSDDNVSEISATSTDAMPGGSGKVVRYNALEGKFSGYGVDE